MFLEMIVIPGWSTLHQNLDSRVLLPIGDGGVWFVTLSLPGTPQGKDKC